MERGEIWRESQVKIYREEGLGCSEVQREVWRRKVDREIIRDVGN